MNESEGKKIWKRGNWEKNLPTEQTQANSTQINSKIPQGSQPKKDRFVTHY
jgi:hypothetical protein